MGPLPENPFGITGTLEDFSQDQYEQYQPEVIKAAHDNYFSFGEAGLSAQAVVRGATVRAAIKAGFLKGVELAEVGKMKPPAVRWLSEEIEKHVRFVTNPPPEETKK